MAIAETTDLIVTHKLPRVVYGGILPPEMQHF
jgi:hypothetical protein